MIDMLMQFLSRILSPDDLRQVGLVAVVTLIVGTLIWLAGIKIARPAVALGAAAGGFALGYFLLPKFADIAPMTAGLIGVAIGLAIGVLAFRFLQASIVAQFASITAAAVYYAFYLAPTLAPPDAAAPAITGWSALTAELLRQYHAIATQDSHRLAILTAGAGLIAWMIALAFPRLTTIVATAAAGSVLIVASLGVLAHLYAPSQLNLLPAGADRQLIVLGIIAVIGAVVQCSFFLPRADKSSKTTGQAAPTTSLRPV